MSYSITPEEPQTSAGQIDQIKLERLIREKQAEQSHVLAVLAGFAASLIAAVLWAAITYATKFQIGFMAVGVGFLVGYAVRRLGQGMTPAFGVIGAAFALFGCLLGNLLTSFVVLSQLDGSSVGTVLLAFISAPSLVSEVMAETFSPIDLLFYGIAIYQGYKLSLHGLTEEEIASASTTAVPATPTASE